MKIGIITIVKVNNYGAELQAFALQKELELLGYDSEIIDYLYYKNWRFKDTRLSSPFVLMDIKGKIIYKLKYRLTNYLIDKILPFFNNSVKNRARRFKEFHQTNTRFSKTYRSMPQLYNDKLGYDIFIAGSDQVWNPASSSSIEPYFLTFVPQVVKKISYASSFGVSHIEPSLQNRFKNLLDNIDEISVRETSGVELVKQLTGRDATLVADPTLLLTRQEWMPYIKEYPNMPKRYVLIYQLSDSDAITELAKKIGQEKNIPVYRICKRAFKERIAAGITNILDAGPAEFLSLTANAEYVVTDSFHGTAFSVNFNIPFFTVVSSKKKNNSRMESLLKVIGLENRMVDDTMRVSSIDDKIDFMTSNKKIDELRDFSIRFLINNLSLN